MNLLRSLLIGGAAVAIGVKATPPPPPPPNNEAAVNPTKLVAQFPDDSSGFPLTGKPPKLPNLETLFKSEMILRNGLYFYGFIKPNCLMKIRMVELLFLLETYRPATPAKYDFYYLNGKEVKKLTKVGDKDGYTHLRREDVTQAVSEMVQHRGGILKGGEVLQRGGARPIVKRTKDYGTIIGLRAATELERTVREMWFADEGEYMDTQLANRKPHFDVRTNRFNNFFEGRTDLRNVITPPEGWFGKVKAGVGTICTAAATELLKNSAKDRPICARMECTGGGCEVVVREIVSKPDDKSLYCTVKRFTVTKNCDDTLYYFKENSKETKEIKFNERSPSADKEQYTLTIRSR